MIVYVYVLGRREWDDWWSWETKKGRMIKSLIDLNLLPNFATAQLIILGLKLRGGKHEHLIHEAR